MNVTREPPVTLRHMASSSGATVLPNLLLDAYHYYRINSDELVLLLHLMRCQDSPLGSELALSDYLMAKMKRTRGEIMHLLRGLHNKGILMLQKDAGLLKPQEVSLHLLYGNLLNWQELPDEKKEETGLDDYTTLVHAFEQTFMHLTHFEYDRIKEWLDVDGWPPEIIVEALETAALSRVLNFKYVDRILLNWQMQGLSTLEEIHQANEAFAKRRGQSEKTEANEPQRMSSTRSRRRSKPFFIVGSINQDEEAIQERRRRLDKLGK